MNHLRGKEHKSKTVENQNFKSWFRNLDPLFRVEQMSQVCKTQESAGLKSYSIKASLAQLTQNCEVQLVRLSEASIERLTRQKNKTELATINHSASCGGESLKRNANSKKRVLTEPRHSSRGGHEKTNQEFAIGLKSSKTHKSIGKLRPNSNKRNHSNALLIESNSLPISHKSSKPNIKRRFQRSIDNHNEPTSATEQENSKKSTNVFVSSAGSDGNNILSATVNVNVYNLPKDRDDSALLASKSHTKNIVLKENCSPKKLLKINVSLCSDETEIYTNNSESKHRKEPFTVRRKGKYVKNSTLSKSSVNKRLTDTMEENKIIKELWSIFGMESPIDRRESIIQSYTSSTLEASSPTTPVSPTFNPVKIFSEERCNHQVSFSEIESGMTKTTAANPNELSRKSNSIDSSNFVPPLKATDTFNMCESNSFEPSSLNLKTTKLGDNIIYDDISSNVDIINVADENSYDQVDNSLESMRLSVLDKNAPKKDSSSFIYITDESSDDEEVDKGVLNMDPEILFKSCTKKDTSTCINIPRQSAYSTDNDNRIVIVDLTILDESRAQKHTPTIIEDEIKSSNSRQVDGVENNKVGKVRVKNIELLLDPQYISDTKI